MKRKILVLSVITLSVASLVFSGCSIQKNNNMSYEQVVSVLKDKSKESIDMFFNIDAQQTDIDLSTNVDIDGVKADVNIQTQAKMDYKSRLEDLSLLFNADVKVPESELDFQTSGALNASLIGNDMYFKLSKFSLKGPNAEDLLMVNMMVNSFKGQWFKFGMSGMNLFQQFDLYDLYTERLGEIVDNAGNAIVNEGSGIYDGIFEEYKGLNSWKYSIDKEKFDEIVHLYADMMNEFYSGLFAQSYQNLGITGEELSNVDFYDILSGITYDNLQGYFIIQGKNEIIETIEGSEIYIDGTGFIINYIYGKDGLYMEIKDESGNDCLIVEINKNGKFYDVQVNVYSFFGVQGNVVVNEYSKKKGIDADFDLNFMLSVESELIEDAEILGETNSLESYTFELPLKGTYKVKNIDSLSLQEPSDAVDLMEMFGGFLGETIDEANSLLDSVSMGADNGEMTD